MNFDIAEVYDYNFDVPSCGNFDDFPIDDTDWFENINEQDEVEVEIDENKENTPTIDMPPNSNGIQRPSFHRKENVENTEDNINEMNNSTDVVCQDPIHFMKSKKDKLLSNLEQFNKLNEKDEDEAFINPNEAPVIPFDDKQKLPEILKKMEIVSRNPAYLKETRTACKPKQVRAKNQLFQTAIKSTNPSRQPAQTLHKKQPTRAVAPSFMTKKPNNNGHNKDGSISSRVQQPPSTTKDGKASAIAGTARTQLLVPTVPGKHAIIPLGALRRKIFDNVSSGDANARAKPAKTVPRAPQLATSQRADIKREKFQATQGSTQAGMGTTDRQLARAKPPVSGKPPVHKSATLGRSAVDRDPGNVRSRAHCGEPKEKGEDKSAARQRLNHANTVPRSAVCPRKNAKNPSVWNY